MATRENFTTTFDKMKKSVGLGEIEQVKKSKDEKISKDTKSTNYMAKMETRNQRTEIKNFETVSPAARTVIAEGCVIRGDIEAKGELVINGNVVGNITCTGNIDCTGSIEGNATAKNINLMAATIKGDIYAHENLIMNNSSTLEGNVCAKNVAMDGKAKGNLTVSGLTQLKANTELDGNIITSRLSIDEGAYFCGDLSMNRNNSQKAKAPTTPTAEPEEAK